MSNKCNPKCIYYKRKDYLVDVQSSDEMQKSLEERLTTDFTGRAFNFGKMMGVKEDCMFYPGDLVTIFGPTGSSKTTLAHNIALGYDAANNRIDTDLQIPTLYLSLELASWYMHRRSLQIAGEYSKDAVSANYQQIYPTVADKLKHINVQTVAPTLEQIQVKIQELQPSLVIVDYIDLVDTPPHVKGEYEQVKYISHGLSNMAVNNDIIILQISQVSREYSRNEVLDLYAGKGSGAIENASRKVIGLNGQAIQQLSGLHPLDYGGQMATNKLTTRDLVGTLIDLVNDREFLEQTQGDDPGFPEEVKPIDEAIVKIKKEMSAKVSGIDYMIVEMNRKKDLMKAEVSSYMDEIKRLRNRQKSIQKVEDYFNKELLPMIIDTAGNDGVFETDTTRYKMYETWGALEITDEDAINDNYKRYKIEIDKKGARKDAIEAAENGMGLSGFKIERTKRIRRS